MANPFAAVGGDLVSRMFGSVLWFGIAILILGVAAFLTWWFVIYRRKFDITVKVHSDRSDDRYKVIFDKAAILYDRYSKSRYFKIWGLKVELPVPRFNVLQSTNKGDLLELRRISDEDFVFLTPPTIDKTTLIKADGKAYPLANQQVKQVEAQTAFWNVKRKQMNRKMFDPESLLMKLLPFIPHIIGGVITIFVLYILMDTLPGVLSSLRELVSELQVLKSGNVITG